MPSNKNNIGESKPIEIYEYPHPMCELVQILNKEETSESVQIWDVKTAKQIIKSLTKFIKVKQRKPRKKKSAK